ncbi:MAG: RidA family protein [Thermomicrobiales bacterium]
MARRTRASSGHPYEAEAGYSRAVRVGDMVFVAGTTAMQDGQAVYPGDAGAQTRHVLGIIVRALEQVGATANDVVRWRVFATDASDAPAIVAELARVFGTARPAATLVEVSRFIHPDSLVEIEVDAVVGCTDE